MKRHVSKTLLVMALTLSSVGSFVGCKDYDEDVYVDLKSRITKETSLREALQIQVNELEAYVKTLKSCECDLSEYLTKLQADKTYMKKADFEDQINQISLNQTAITLINKAIDDINWKLDQIKPFDDSDILKKINDLNNLILSVKETANQALEAATLGKCECNLKPLEDRVKTLEGLVAGWGERIEAVTSTAEKALAKAEKDSILLVKQQKTIDSLINVINNMDNTIKETVLKRIETLEKNTYTKAEIDKIIRDLNIPDVQPLLDRIKNIEDNYLTKKQIEDMINAIPVTDLSPIERRLAALEGHPVVDAYTKSEIDQMLQNLDIPQTDLTEILNRLNTLEGKHFWTEQEILDLIDDALPEPYDHQAILDRLAALEAKPHVDAYNKDEIDEMIGDLNDAIEDAQDLAQDAFDLATDNQGLISGLDTRVGDLEDAMTTLLETTIPGITDRLTALEGRVGTLETKVNELDTKVNKLVQDLEKLQNDLQKMITGIIVQGTQNPVIGYLNTPLDVRSTLLGVYYGEAASDWQFPSANSAHYARNVEFQMLESNFERISQILGENTFGQESGGAGETLVTLGEDGTEEGNAGTLYLTVNPANVDFVGAALKLHDSQDNELDILSPLQKSDRLLTMSYTRSADNGFYEAAATITADQVENMKFEVDMENLQEDVKGMFKDFSDVYSICDFGANIINSLKTQLPAYAVMASWQDESSAKEATDTQDAEEGTIHKLYSQYNIGAMAVKPLSFSFLQDVKLIDKAPFIEDLEDLVDDIVNEINISISSDLPDFSEYGGKIEFTDFTLPNIDDDKFKVKVKITLDDIEEQILKDYFGRDLHLDAGRNGKFYIVFNKEENEYVLEVEQTYNDGSKRYSTFCYNKETGQFTQDGNEIANAILPLDFEFEIDKADDAHAVLEQILESVNAKVGANGTLSQQVTDLLNEVAEIGDLNERISVSISNSKDNIKSVLDRYVTRLNSKLTNCINTSTSIMHIALMANNGNRVGILSQKKAIPTVAPGELDLYPTTYNLELLAPAYKKFVAVSDVYNLDGTPLDLSEAKTKAQAANGGENMNKVINGSVACKFNGEPGYIYEVLYTAVDYFGKVALKKYYVRFE
jgi:chaperonin cofactor prefoldin